MSTYRRTLIITIALPVWIMMILTGGQWCLMPGSASAHPVVSSAAGMGHAATQADAGHGHHAGLPDESRDRLSPATWTEGAASSDTSAHTGHGADGRPCDAQAACSIAIAAATLQLTDAPRPGAWRRLVAVAEHPVSLTLAPELPPPRA